MSQSAIIHEGMNHNFSFQLQRLEEDANFLLMCGTGRSRALCGVHAESSSASRAGGLDDPLFCCQDENIDLQHEGEVWRVVRGFFIILFMIS